MFILLLLALVYANLIDKLKFIDKKISLASNIEYPQARNRFLNGIKLKNTFQYTNQLEDLHLFHIKQNAYPNTQLLVCKYSQKSLFILNQLGIVLTQYTHPYDIILSDFYHIQDEFQIAIYDSNSNLSILNMTVDYISTKDQPQEDIRLVDQDGFYQTFNLSLYTSFQLNQTITTLLLNQGRNTKVFLIGDEDGYIAYYYQNGTLKSRNKLSQYPILSLIRRHPHMLYQTQKNIGFVNSVSLQSVSPKCDQPAGLVKQVYQENIYGQTLYVLLENKDVLVYQLKSGKHQECSIQYKIPIIELPSHIRVINNYLVAYDHTLQVYNTSLYRAYYQDEMILLNSLNDNEMQFDYYSLRSAKLNGLMSVVYEIYSLNNVTTIRQFELVHHQMQISSQFSLMESFRFPMILVAIFIVFIFQFWQKQHKGSSESDELSVETRKKIDQMVSEYQKYDKPD